MHSLTFFSRVNTDQMAVFRTMAALAAARVPLVEALDECRRQAGNAQTRKWVSRTRDRVNAGESFSAALEAEAVVPSLVTALVRTAESTGTLSDALEKAADILELRYERTRTLVSALLYPAVILFVTLAASLFLAAAVIPQMETMYRQAGRNLPLITHVMRYAVYGVLGFAAAAALAALISRRIRLRVMTGDMSFPHTGQHPSIPVFRYRLPVFGNLSETHATAFWAYSLGTLLNHGIPLPEALELTARNVPPGSGMASDILAAHRRILAGENPGDAFQSIKTLPPLARRLLAGGDAAGNLADACDRIHHIYDTEYRLRTRRLTVFAEPIAVVIAGCFVILAALAVVLPVADLGGLL